MRLKAKNIHKILPLSPMQKGMLFETLIQPRSYYSQMRVTVKHRFGREQVENAWKKVVDAHEMLRSVFRWERITEPVQIILKSVENNTGVEYIDTNLRTEKETEVYLTEIAQQEKEKNIDICKEVIRVTAVATEKTTELLFSFHHIVTDGWSNSILLADFLGCCQENDITLSLSEGFDSHLNYLKYHDWSDSHQYWQQYLMAYSGETYLPWHTSAKTVRVKRYLTFMSDASMLQAYKRLNQLKGLPASAVFYAAWGAVLKEITSQSDVVFGTTVSGRSALKQDQERIIGPFINTVPFRMQDCDGLMEVKNLIVNRTPYENYPLTEILNIWNLNRKKIPLFKTLVVIENYPIMKTTLIDIEKIKVTDETNYDITIGVLLLSDTSIKIVFEYDSTLIDEQSAKNLLDKYIGTITKWIK